MAEVTRREITKTAASKDDLGVSWTHLELCLDGERKPSADLAQRVAEYVGIPVADFWGDHIGVAA